MPTEDSAERLRAERDAAAAQVRVLERRLRVLAGAVQEAGTLLDPTMVARLLMERAAALLGAVRWRLYRVDEPAGMLRLDVCDDQDASHAGPLALERGLASWVARAAHSVRVSDPATDSRLDREAEWPRLPEGELLAAPLRSRGRVIAVAELALGPGGVLRAEDAALLEALLDPAAIALDNAMLFRKLEERTVTDDLTRLYNARYMESVLRREAKRAQRYGHGVALLFLDLDGFKQVNDVHGHMAGSRTLVEVGDLLRANVREIDVVARWGGDEFAVVLPETGAEGALTMAERIREVVAATPYLGGLGLDVRLTVSVGVATWPANGTDWEQLLAAADGAMYQVKYSGKNAVRLADSVTAR